MAPKWSYVKGFVVLATLAIVAGVLFGSRVAVLLIVLMIALIALSGWSRTAQILEGL